MPTRDLYRQKFSAQLHEWNARLDLLVARSERLEVKAKLEVTPLVDAVHERLTSAKAALAEIAAATDDRWAAVVKDADKVWADLKAAADGANDALKRHAKH
jgi:hypothetical protein